jgi:hypothetical protein
MSTYLDQFIKEIEEADEKEKPPSDESPENKHSAIVF